MRQNQVKRSAGRKPKLGFERLEARQLLAGRPIVSEFVADNDDSLADGFGRSADWIELVNAGDAPVDLAGWYLSDAAGNLTKWQFPDVPAAELDPGEYLVVFASGDGIADPAGNLHTSFNLNADGNHLALTMPDGLTVVSRFGPDGADFPPQYQDVSYGVVDVVEESVLVAGGANASVLIPDAVDDANYQTNWRGGNETAFQAAGGTTGWTSGPTPVGFGATTTPLTRYRSAVTAEPSLLSLYTFENDAAGPGGVQDSEPTGTPHHGTLTGTATTSAVGIGSGSDRALSLPGASAGYVALSSVSEFEFGDSSGTVEMWIKPTWTAGTAGINPSLFAIRDGSGSRYSIHLRNNLDLFDIYTTGASCCTAFAYSYGVANPNEWHHVAVVFQPGTATIFVDGESRGTLAVSLGPSGRSVQIGHSLASTEYWRGAIDEVAIYGDALSDEAVSSHYEAFSTPSIVVGTDVTADMAGSNATAYLRTTFNIADREAFDSLTLRVKHDDGFVAFLNGVEVARANAPALLDYLAAATASHDPDAAVPYDISAQALGPGGALQTGTNVLAIHGLNAAAGDGDFFIEPELVGSAVLETQTRYFPTPTPGQPNAGGVEGIVADTQFAGENGVFHSRGFYDAPFDVTVSSATPGATLVYTTNGSAPTLANGTVVAPPSAATPPSSTIRIAGTTTLRAAAFKMGFAPANVDTQTYVFLADVIAQPEMDFDIKNNPAYSGELRDDLTAIPSLSLVLDSADMFGPSGIYTNPQSTGPSWERGVSVEYLDPNSPEQFQIDGGIQIQGADSRNHQKKAFRLLFKEQYGAGKLDAPLFDGSTVDSFDRLVLRSGGHDAWTSPHAAPEYSQATSASYIRDQFIRETQQVMGHAAVHGKFVHLYINGQYWGVYNLTELPDENFASDHLGGSDADWDVIKGPDGGGAVADAGDKTAWNAMMAIAAAGLTSSTAYQQIQAYLDVDNFIDFMIAKIWAGDTDWLHSNNEPQTGARNKNWFAVRNRTEPGAKFHFLAWDSEFVLGKDHRANRETDINVTDVDSADSPGQLYQALRGNAEFRLHFADRLQKHLANDGALSVAANRARWDALVGALDGPVVAESARWGDALVSFVPFTRNDHWRPEVAWIRDTFFAGRNASVLSQFEAIGLFPSVDAPALTVSGSPQHGGTVVPGASIGLTNPNTPPGAIYFTTDGSDPRQPPTVTSTVLVSADTPAFAFGPRATNGGSTLGTAWTSHDFDHASWTPSPTGSVIGFDKQPATGENYIPLLDLNVQSLADLAPANASIYIRVPFTIASQSEIDAIDSLLLRMKYDDGFAAYINGQPLGLPANAPSPLAWNSNAPADRPDSSAIAFQDFVLAQTPASLLRVGTNVLAIHALNRSVSSSDLLIAPELLAVQTGNDIAPGAQLYTGPFVIDESTNVKARILRGTTWSALTDALFTVETPLRVTELNYHPGDRSDAELAAGIVDDDDFEFVELQNIHDTATIDLAGVRFTDGIEFTFGNESLAPGERIAVVRNRVAFDHRYGEGIRIAGEYGTTPEDYKFNNSGETITLLDAGGGVIQSFAYRDDWHPATDGGGPTLVVVDSHAARELWSLSTGWRESYDPGGSPGERDRMIGDANDDLRVDLLDVALLQSNFGLSTGAAWNNGDFNRDGAVNRTDVALMAARFGRSIASPAASSPRSTVARANVEMTPPARLTARAARLRPVAADRVLADALQSADRPLAARRSRAGIQDLVTRDKRRTVDLN